MLWNPCIAASRETNICIKNLTSQPHLITVYDIKNFDWDGNGRPDHNFNNVTISPDQRICQREEINTNSSGQKFTFGIDGSPTRVSYNYTNRQYSCKITITNESICKYWWTDLHWGITSNPNNPLALHGEKNIFYQPADWWVGYPCDFGKDCREFHIK